MYVLGPRGRRLIEDMLQDAGGCTRTRRAIAVPGSLSSTPPQQWRVYVRDGALRCTGGARHVIGVGYDYVSDHEVASSVTECAVVLRYTQPSIDSSGALVSGSWQDSQAAAIAQSEAVDTATTRCIVLAMVASDGSVTQYWSGHVWVIRMLDRGQYYTGT